MSVRNGKLTSQDWFGKASAGVILGFGLALAISGLFAWFGPGGLGESGGKVQLNMWLMSPIWMAVVSFCFLFRDAARAWLWLGGANLVAFGLLLSGRWLIA